MNPTSYSKLEGQVRSATDKFLNFDSDISHQLLEIVKFDAKASSEIKYIINICEANISQRSYFTRRKAYFIEKTANLVSRLTVFFGGTTQT